MPCISCPSGIDTTTSGQWISSNSFQSWLLNASESSRSKRCGLLSISDCASGTGFLGDPVVQTADSACLLYPTQMRRTRGGDSYYSCSSRRIPRRCAIATASVRVLAFNLPNIALTYVLTVPSVTVSFCAIFLLLSPTIICRRVASSLAVNASCVICSAIRCATRAPTATPPLCTEDRQS